MPKSTGDEWFGAPAAAQYLGLYLTTLYRLIIAGDLPAYQIGRVIRLRRGEVDAYIERSRVRPGELDHLLNGSDTPSWARDPRELRRQDRRLTMGKAKIRSLRHPNRGGKRTRSAGRYQWIVG